MKDITIGTVEDASLAARIGTTRNGQQELSSVHHALQIGVHGQRNRGSARIGKSFNARCRLRFYEIKTAATQQAGCNCGSESIFQHWSFFVF
jgi:hypothetical protein